MKQGISIARGRAVVAMVASSLAVSCGSGIHSGKGEVFESATVEPAGGTVAVEDGILRLYQGAVTSPSVITLRRYDEVVPAGAVSPVFEVQLPTPDTLKVDPRLDIHSAAAVSSAPTLFTMGFLSPMSTDLWIWVPDSTSSYPDCAEGYVCGPVQGQSFTKPAGGGVIPPTDVLRLAILRTCKAITDCGSSQTCQSGVCQQCLSPTNCNQ
jgi:hypothetical protein